METKDVDRFAQIIWNYMLMHQALEKSDAIFCLGSFDLSIADYASELFKEGWAPIVIFSGGLAHQDDYLKTDWDRPEAEVFADRAIELGVSGEAIIVENQATNTGENFSKTKALLDERGIDIYSFICVQKPYMERRTYATGNKEWPEKEIIVSSPQLSLDEYASGEISKERHIHTMVGDLQRIKIYSEKGFQIPQEIPEEVWNAYEQLVALGYDKNLID